MDAMALPAANIKTPELTTKRALNLSSKYPAGICMQANPKIKAPLASDTPRSLACRLVFIAFKKTAEAVFRQKE